MARSFDERELSPVFLDPRPVIENALRRTPSTELLKRLEARRGRRSSTEQPTEDCRAQALRRAPFEAAPQNPGHEK